MMFCDLQYVEESLAVVGKLVYADLLLVLSLYKTMKNLENIEKYIRTCGGRGRHPIISAILKDPVKYGVIQLQLEPVK